MISIYDDNGGLIARFTFTTTQCVAKDVVIRQSSARDLMTGLRAIPRQVVKVDVTYPRIKNVPLPFNSVLPGDYTMNFEMLEAAQVAQPRSTDDAKSFFVIPSGDTLPDDGVLMYVEIVDVYQLKDTPEHSVLVFSPTHNEDLKCVVENSGIFKANLTRLMGVPGANYSPEFASATWPLQEAAYASLVTELRVAGDIERMRKDEDATSLTISPPAGRRFC